MKLTINVLLLVVVIIKWYWKVKVPMVSKHVNISIEHYSTDVTHWIIARSWRCLMWSLMWPGAEPSFSLMTTTKQTCLSVSSQPDVRKTIAIFLFPPLNTSVAPNSLWLDSKSLAWHRFQVMIWDVISAEQESKQRRYLQKVSHMLNQWQGTRGTGTAASPSAIWQVTHTHTHTIYTHTPARAHSMLAAAGIILIILCVDVEEN